MAYNRGDEDKSTWQRRAPTQQEIDEWRRDPRNHVTPGLQEIPNTGPTKPHREIARLPHAPVPERRPQPTTTIVYH
jgi:hypothetical protein